MLLAIDSRDPRPIYRQIMDEIRRVVVLRIVGEDDPLPSVRQLAGELRVNPNTVTQAYRALEKEGVLYVRRGLGTYVARPRRERAGTRRAASAVAERALRDAHRHGFSAAELVAAVRAAAHSGTFGSAGSSRKKS